MKTEFVVDDFDAMHDFVRSLPPKIKKERFSNDLLTKASAKWKPRHIVLAVVEGKTVAMADAVYSDDRRGANASLVALRNHGAHALKAYLHLKRKFPAEFWESSLRDPTPATLAISRRFFDATYDQGTWDIHQEMLRLVGPDMPFVMTPILANDSMIKGLNLPKISDMPVELKRDIVASAIPRGAFSAPSIAGREIDVPRVQAIAFDIIDAPLSVRKYTTRFMVMSAFALTGQIRDFAKLRPIIKPRFFQIFCQRLEIYLKQ